MLKQFLPFFLGFTQTAIASFSLQLNRVSDKQVDIKSTSSIPSEEIYSLNTIGFPSITDKTSDVSYRVGLLRLVEYNDTISPIASTSKCSVAYTANTTNGQFTSIQTDNFGLGTSNDIWHLSTVMTGSVDCPSITVMLDTITVSKESKVYGVDFHPDETLSWYTIAGFPYKYLNSKLALVQVVESNQNIGLNTTVSKLTFGNTNQAYVYDYNQVINDDLEHPVKASVYENKLFPLESSDSSGASDFTKGNLLYLTFPVSQPAKIHFISSYTKRPNENKTNTTTSLTILPTIVPTIPPNLVENQQASDASVNTFGFVLSTVVMMLILMLQ